jgi:predicted MFS family arabinose efflux permease
MGAATMVSAGRRPANHSGKSVTRDMGVGFSYAFGNPILLGLVMMMFVPTLFGFTYYTLLPAWAREVLNVQSDGLGLLMMMMGIGALIGTMALASMRNLSRRGAFLLSNSIVWGIAIASFSQSTSYAMALPFLLLLGLLSSVFMSLNMTLIQVYSSPEMRGRMMSIAIMTFGIMPLSSVPFGAIAESIGTANALGLSGVLLAVVTGVFALLYPALRKIA